ncbi:MAG TPA: biotin--[acetyl-CoA-carboxylase] ligase [Actinomycetota bacterium]|nr:biotin--[acetyl-CoA-carboxylase] ligase [Actinomycetota bacterium]
MLSEDALVRALERVGLRAPVRFEEVTASTQATALELAAAGTPEWTLVAAGHQTEGRGRLGRTWHDEPGRALMFSLVLRPELDPDSGGLLTLLAGTAMARACFELADQRAACKWPNDLLIAGRKAGGILAESRVDEGRFEHVVIGIGVNLGAPPSEIPQAGSVEAEDDELLEAFLSAFVRGYEPAHPAFAGSVVAAYREVCATLGTRVRAATAGGAVVEGEAVEVDERGGLVVRTPAGDEVVRFGAVEHLE